MMVIAQGFRSNGNLKSPPTTLVKWIHTSDPRDQDTSLQAICIMYTWIFFQCAGQGLAKPSLG